MKRLKRLDTSLKRIDLYSQHLGDAWLSELVDRLLAHPDVVTEVNLDNNALTDEIGVQLARYLAASSTIAWLGLSSNRFGPATYSAVAQALRVNTSLRELYMDGNQVVESSDVDAAFVEALRVNPCRPNHSIWWLFNPWTDDLARLSVTHPSLQSLLLAQLLLADASPLVALSAPAPRCALM